MLCVLKYLDVKCAVIYNFEMGNKNVLINGGMAKLLDM